MELFKRLNERIYEFEQVYIWGLDLDAKNIFISCLQQDLRIDGFITEEEKYEGLKFFNRPVFYVKHFKPEGKIAVLTQKSEYFNTWQENLKGENTFFAVETETDNSAYTYADLKEDGVIIWGCGPSGIATLEILKKLGNEKIWFTDSNEKYWGTCIDGFEVISPEELYNAAGNVTVILAISKWREVYPRLAQNENIKIYVDIIERENNFSKIVFFKEAEIKTLYPLFRESVNVIYEVVRKAERKDIIFVGCSWEIYEIKKIFELCGVTIKAVLNSAYDADNYDKEKSLFVITDLDVLTERIMYENGYKPLENYVCIKNGTIPHLGYIGYKGWDPLFGDTYESEDGLYGITKHGNDCATKKVVVLGNSTTDEKFFSFRSWCKCLYELAIEEGIDIQIINLGHMTSNSYHELMKLLRDGFRFNPDVVISYSGVRDFQVDKNKMIHPSALVGARCFSKNISKTLWLGCDDNRKPVEQWFDNERIMYRLCKERGIEFVACLQPYSGVHRKTLAVDWEMDLNSMLIYKDTTKGIQEFRDKISLHKDEGWLFDESDMFEGESIREIFMDRYHVVEKGNQMIARRILEILKSKNLV